MMKKHLLVFLLVLSVPFLSFGQEFQQGSKVVSVGVGLGSAVGSGLSYNNQIPAISAQYEQGIWEVGGPGVISLGGYIGYKGYRNTYGAGFESKWNYTLIGIRSAYHYNGLNVDNLDVYGGAMLGYYLVNYTDNSGMSYGNFNNSLGLSIYVGGRYYFSENIGAFAELGYGVSYLNIGLAFKL